MHGMAQYSVAGHDLIADSARLLAVGADDPGVLVAVLEDEAKHRTELRQLLR